MNIQGLDEGQVESAVRACLAEVPFLRIERVLGEARPAQSASGLLFDLVSADGRRQLVIEARRNGEPRLAREAIASMRRHSRERPASYLVFAAPYVSPRTSEVCREEEVGYVDLSGNCRLCFDKVYIEREGRPNTFARKRDLRKLYSPKASRVLRVLLNAPRAQWTLSALAREAQVSIGLVWKVKELLADREWVLNESRVVTLPHPERSTTVRRAVSPVRMTLARPGELLAEWARAYSYRQNGARDYYSLQKPAELERALAEACARRGIRCALTAFSAAERMAPMVRYQRVFAYAAGGIADLAAELDLKEVPSGANVTLLDPYDEGVFYGARTYGDIRTVSPVQAYLDLFSNKGRGEEAAQTLLREVIRLQW